MLSKDFHFVQSLTTAGQNKFQMRTNVLYILNRYMSCLKAVSLDSHQDRSKQITIK